MRDRVTLWITVFIGAFIVISLLGQFILVYTGRIEDDEGIWRPLFDLVAILVGAVAGYVGGVEIERVRRQSKDEKKASEVPPPEVPHTGENP